MQQAFFLTGTDTEIGKTFASCALLHAWRSQGYRAVGYKPVAAGAEWLEERWSNEDARRLQQAGSPGFTLAEINPICLQAAVAPHIAAREEGRSIEQAEILTGFSALQPHAERIVVEGVGGFRVPLGENFDSADLAQSLRLPIILVVGLRLGCINHALLTAEAITARGLPLAGWIGNTLSPRMMRLEENLATLQTLLPAPCLGILPFVETGDAALAASHLRLEKLHSPTTSTPGGGVKRN
ncbi:MAG: dethiobiotin synthase [Candidatus Dactylopiibacterium carminicum]|uniref:ATP-dependent dethiobiotin synthetase BioD n=1 Tax=Candidatus Dactylopiibacterium carminicum TaxID=857335 RepID=A0A272EU09_9RHOO|nr:dethiobiotin synthase [Candidatus Dactylopiibacterium carminicum]KAF7599649.1 dethiobiotin synthase [Candidatus Dactylopiibacterium carminicum]PAS93573.1 MAG: dethiobiotin synthase [Candidatus Dactylopiibacterium carminicum]PAS97434.1 MAG: dethiobiotin synthase [Candidatus Dactylopiibacterium carminicum]PAS99650.1 MAG: dethiobiotin synthase [Candidatus Dactylopiibacterium carminicum]